MSLDLLDLIESDTAVPGAPAASSNSVRRHVAPVVHAYLRAVDGDDVGRGQRGHGLRV